ncbi:SAM-dependent methyltransferase [Nonomuraea sp. NPDC048916]|uniref:SAM-dependent methyltransferase n=1 Tax=Nonomuraea sp. NPDC048916 TaxID=3154232 RepID=UPI0034112A35
MVEFDPQAPNLARMYDYMLGGDDNTAVDREVTDRLAALFPQAVPLARTNREFVQRAVRYLAHAGVHQFLDLGSGLPSQGHVHEVAPAAKVVYVDHDPVVATRARDLLEESGLAAFVQADLLDAGAVLERVSAHLDLDRPVGVVLASVLHFVPDSAGPQAMVARLRDALAPGSHLVITHATSVGRLNPEDAAKVISHGSSAAGADRTPAGIRAFFGDFALVEPGLVNAPDWRPDRPRLVGEPSAASYLMAGVGAKR